jgi:hypothetical protein
MRQQDGPCRCVLQNVARGPTQKHLAQAAIGISAHHQQPGIMLCRRCQSVSPTEPKSGATTSPVAAMPWQRK